MAHNIRGYNPAVEIHFQSSKTGTNDHSLRQVFSQGRLIEERRQSVTVENTRSRVETRSYVVK